MSDLTQLFPTDFRLRRGPGQSVERGLCFMETAAFIAGEPISDQPTCACPMLTAFGIELNDTAQAFRDQLLPLAWAVAGTRNDAAVHWRAVILAATVMRAQRRAFHKIYDRHLLLDYVGQATGIPSEVGETFAKMLDDVLSSARTHTARTRIVAAALHGFRRAIKAGPHGGFPDEATCARVREGLQRAPYVREAVSA